VSKSNAWNNEPEEQPLSPAEIFSQQGTAQPLEQLDWEKRGVFGFNSRDSRSRSFNLLRAQVLKITQARNWKIIGVTSATPRVGKSFMAANLAASLSRIPGTHTLLFDLDLRRGSIAETFDITEGVGINSFLAGEVASLDEAARDVVGTRLTIFPSFRGEESSAELLAGARFKTLVKAMRSLPDNVICICDLPPAFANDDAAIILREIDAYLLVVEEGKTTARQVSDTIEVLRPAPCLGTVLNRYHGGIAGDDYGFGYGTYGYYAAYYN
jgi:protein-tyrosine kinase